MNKHIPIIYEQAHTYNIWTRTQPWYMNKNSYIKAFSVILAPGAYRECREVWGENMEKKQLFWLNQQKSRSVRYRYNCGLGNDYVTPCIYIKQCHPFPSILLELCLSHSIFLFLIFCLFLSIFLSRFLTLSLSLYLSIFISLYLSLSSLSFPLSLSL